MNKDFIKKYSYILLTLCTAILTLIFSKANMIVKVISIVGQVFINKYILKIFIEKVTMKYKKIKLPEVECLSINPKLDYFISIFLDIFLYCFIMYFIMIININGFTHINLKHNIPLMIFVVIIAIIGFIYGMMGAEIQITKEEIIIYLKGNKQIIIHDKKAIKYFNDIYF